ncbi:MAG TPA: stage III sporulation protein AD [Halanaerobiales bacterium]|nr:stage III sporulation protein AD [Halanaerobiales bacterium]
MGIMQVVGFAVLAVILIIVIRQERPELAFLLSMLTGMVILIMVIEKVGVVIELLTQLAHRAEVDLIYFNTIIKIIGIAYIGEFGAEITRDSGEKALASKIEMAAKVLIMITAIPIMLSLIESIIGLIP